MRKDLNYYFRLRYPITIHEFEQEGKIYYEAEIPDLPGCGAHGKTVDEALNKLDEAKIIWLEVSLERNLPIAEPPGEEDFSGRILLRIPPKLHSKLTQEAKKENLSLNQYIRHKLETDILLETILEKIEELSKKSTKNGRRNLSILGYK
ncbi:MAG: toxin-antitoxin system HicB family antitoxin [Candidatus Aminicenantes bacterium]|nr:toxin-antitoxin system HicB family antitoxin [Candidatus Aminicenantes bacterium]